MQFSALAGGSFFLVRGGRVIQVIAENLVPLGRGFRECPLIGVQESLHVFIESAEDRIVGISFLQIFRALHN